MWRQRSDGGQWVSSQMGQLLPCPKKAWLLEAGRRGARASRECSQNRYQSESGGCLIGKYD